MNIKKQTVADLQTLTLPELIDTLGELQGIVKQANACKELIKNKMRAKKSEGKKFIAMLSDKQRSSIDKNLIPEKIRQQATKITEYRELKLTAKI